MSLKQKFEKFGFIVLRDAFVVEDCDKMKEVILDYFTDASGQLLKNTTKNYRDGKQCTAPLAFNNAELKEIQMIFSNKKLNNALREIADNKLVFLHHSDAHVDTVAGKGWHADSINNSDGRSGGNWKDQYVKHDYWTEYEGENYCVIRLALYLQNHYDNQDGLFVVAGSHLKDNFNKELYLKTKMGDVILFDARLQHRGGANVKKGNHRSAIFWGMGRDNIFSHEHRDAAIARQTYQLSLSEYGLNESLKNVLDKNNIGY